MHINQVTGLLQKGNIKIKTNSSCPEISSQCCLCLSDKLCTVVSLYRTYLEFHTQPSGCFPYNPSRHLPESHSRTRCRHREETTEAASLKNKTKSLSYFSPCSSTTSNSRLAANKAPKILGSPRKNKPFE